MQMNFPFIIHSSDVNGRLIDQIAAGRDNILDRLHESGAVLLRGFDVGGVDGFASAVRALSGEPLAYTERSSPRTRATSTPRPTTRRPRRSSSTTRILTGHRGR